MSQSSGQTRADQEAILATIHKFFDGLKLKSAEMMLTTVLPNSHGTLTRPSPDGSPISRIVQTSMAELIEHVTGGMERMEENIALATWQNGDDGDRFGGRKTYIMVDRDVGVAWAPFEVLMDGVVVSVGTNVFNLVRKDIGDGIGRWVICGVADTARPVDGGN